MMLICVVLAVSLCLAVSAASYFIATSVVLGKVVKEQKRQHRRDVRQANGLLDRLLLRHGFSALTEPLASKDTSAVMTMPVDDPFSAAEAEWEQEDRERFRVAAMGDEEKADLIREAQKLVY